MSPISISLHIYLYMLWLREIRTQFNGAVSQGILRLQVPLFEYRINAAFCFGRNIQCSNSLLRDNIVTITADSQQGMESVSKFKMTTVTENYWLISIQHADTVIWCYHVGCYFQSPSNLKLALRFPCPVDRDDIVSLKYPRNILTLSTSFSDPEEAEQWAYRFLYI